MKIRFQPNLKREVCEIYAGEFYATRRKDLLLYTLLGSCIAVCLFDQKAGVYGMNHFMLPKGARASTIFSSSDARFGVYAMELLINDMMKQGANRKNMRAKVFGGGRVFNHLWSNVSRENIQFIETFLRHEEILVVAKDLGGETGRKVYFHLPKCDVYVKKIRTSRCTDLLDQELEYLDRMERMRRLKSNLTLFED